MNGSIMPLWWHQIYGAVVANHSSTRPPGGHQVRNYSEESVLAFLFFSVLYIGVGWMLIRWFWLNYKASKHIIELYTYIMAEMQRAAIEDEADDEESKDPVKPNVNVDRNSIFKKMKSDN